MRISELAKRSGVSGHTLRYYEARGLLRASRDRSGYRDFPEATLRDLRCADQRGPTSCRRVAPACAGR